MKSGESEDGTLGDRGRHLSRCTPPKSTNSTPIVNVSNRRTRLSTRDDERTHFKQLAINLPASFPDAVQAHSHGAGKAKRPFKRRPFGDQDPFLDERSGTDESDGLGGEGGDIPTRTRQLPQATSIYSATRPFWTTYGPFFDIYGRGSRSRTIYSTMAEPSPLLTTATEWRRREEALSEGLLCTYGGSKPGEMSIVRNIGRAGEETVARDPR